MNFCLYLGDRLLSPDEWSGRTAITVPAKGVGGLVSVAYNVTLTTIKILYHVPVKSSHLILFQMEIKIS